MNLLTNCEIVARMSYRLLWVAEQSEMVTSYLPLPTNP